MSVLVVGVNHRTAPLSVLERFALDAQEVAKAVSGLAALDSVREAVVVSTCNRTEVYAIAELFHQGFDDIQQFLCTSAGVEADVLSAHMYTDHDAGAIEHLFAVACGIDSMVIGEGEILGQVRDAWEIARAEGAARTGLNLLFRHSLEVGKRARTDTDISRGTASISHAAVEMAQEHLGDLTGRSVAIVGAGTMGEGISVALRGAGVGNITVLNRTPAHGMTVAERTGATLRPLDDLSSVVADVDLVLTCTGANEPIITTATLDVPRTSQAPLLIIDVAVPRDVHHDVGDLPSITILDLDDLQSWANRGIQQRTEAVAAVQVLIDEEIDRYSVASASMQAAPLVAALRERFDDIRRAELSKVEGRLDDEARRALDVATTKLIAKLLHEPSVRLRLEAGTPRGERLASAVVDLFNLDDPTSDNE